MEKAPVTEEKTLVAERTQAIPADNNWVGWATRVFLSVMGAFSINQTSLLPRTRKADVAKHLKAFGHVGTL